MLTEPFKKGIHAYLEGKNINDNPYDVFLGGSWNNYSQWQDGFLDAEEIANGEYDIKEEVKEYMEKMKTTNKLQEKHV